MTTLAKLNNTGSCKEKKNQRKSCKTLEELSPEEIWSDVLKLTTHSELLDYIKSHQEPKEKLIVTVKKFINELLGYTVIIFLGLVGSAVALGILLVLHLVLNFLCSYFNI